MSTRIKVRERRNARNDRGRRAPVDRDSQEETGVPEPDAQPSPRKPASETARPSRPPSVDLPRSLSALRARLSRNWEQTLALAIGVATLTAALLTYLAVVQDDKAGNARGQAVLETLQVQERHVEAMIRVYAETGDVADYRSLLAQAEALDRQSRDAAAAGNGPTAAELTGEALLLRAIASGRGATFDPSLLRGEGATAVYDTKARLLAIEGYRAFDAIDPAQPGLTIERAAEHQSRSEKLMASVGLLLAVVLILTIGRALPVRWRKVAFGCGAMGYVLATTTALMSAVPT